MYFFTFILYFVDLRHKASRFVRFVIIAAGCHYKWERKAADFLEGAEIRYIFARIKIKSKCYDYESRQETLSHVH